VVSSRANRVSSWSHPRKGAQRWRPLAFGDTDFDRPDWIDPAADRHHDLAKWTNVIRDQLAATASSVSQTLDLIEAHPYNR
jgi:hypothetical protein